MSIYKGNQIICGNISSLGNVPVGVPMPYSGALDKLPVGYILCDGAQYNISSFPQLYEVIGTTYNLPADTDTTKFRVPDYRECVLVGVGQNATSTIETHDVYGLGEFKDDQMQTHTHTYLSPSGGSISDCYGSGSGSYQRTGVPNGRVGSTTHGKQIGVYYIIKAINYSEAVLNAVGYSADEVDTGMLYTVDGVSKKIYRKVVLTPVNYTVNSSNWTTTGINISFIDVLIGYNISSSWCGRLDINISENYLLLFNVVSGDVVTLPAGTPVILEYTKTT